MFLLTGEKLKQQIFKAHCLGSWRSGRNCSQLTWAVKPQNKFQNWSTKPIVLLLLPSF